MQAHIGAGNEKLQTSRRGEEENGQKDVLGQIVIASFITKHVQYGFNNSNYETSLSQNNQVDYGNGKF